MKTRRATVALALSFLPAALVLAQEPPPASAPQTPQPSTLAAAVEPTNESAVLTYFNRPIIVLRARVLGLGPAERAALSVRTLDEILSSGSTGPINTQVLPSGTLLSVGRQVIVGITPLDIDAPNGETVESVTKRTAARLQEALNAAAEARRPTVWLRGGALAVIALAAAILFLSVLSRFKLRMTDWLSGWATGAVARVGLAGRHAARARHLLAFALQRIVSLVVFGAQLAIAYWLVMFTLRRFPYTRPWGDSLRDFIVTTARDVAGAIVYAMPSLFMIVIIVMVTRVAINLLEPWFDAVERGSISVRWLHRETATTSRRLVTVLLWLFAAALAFPYVPGSDTDAFKGISVFVGLMVSLGSSGLVNQLMSGVMLTYSRALRMGDYVRIGDIEGTITHLGVLSTKLRTLRAEEVTVPNAVVVSQTITDYSRFADAVRTTTFVTIGYDVPWRQVHAMLILAAERTPGIRPSPEPLVFQSALEDSGVKYTLNYCLDQQQSRVITLSALHAHIQDLFNEHGVQIMTPSYEGDPETPKVVPKQKWFASPADAESEERRSIQTIKT